MTQEKAQRKSLEPYLKDDVEFYKHQVEGIRHIAKQGSHILADDMGLGKSLQAITVFCIMLKMQKAQTCIIVCPVTLRENWADELEKFTRLSYVRLGEEVDSSKRKGVRKLTPRERDRQLQQWLHDSGPRVLICNYEQISTQQHQETLRRARIDFGIYDEAHYIKNPKSKRTQAIHKLNTKFSLMLTGTPMLNQVDELWSLLHKVDPGRFPKYWSFVNRYCVYGGYGDKQIVGTKNAHELRTHLGKHMTRRLKVNTLAMDKPNYVTVTVGLSELQQKMYDSAAEDFLLELPGSNREAVEIANAMTKSTRLLQICDTPYCIDNTFPDDSQKLDRAIEIIAEMVTKGERVPVFTMYRGVLDALQTRLANASIAPVFALHGGIPQDERVPTVKMWSESTYPGVLLCMSQVAGVGLNMVAASNIIRIDRLFVPGLNQQVVDRVHRIGQKKPVQVFDLVTRKTVESRVLSIVRSKTKLNEDIVEGSAGMRSLLQKLKEQLEDDLR